MDETLIPSTAAPDAIPVFVPQSEDVLTGGNEIVGFDPSQKGLGTYTANPNVSFTPDAPMSATTILDSRLNPKVGGEIANPGAMNAILVVSLKAQVENLLNQINDLTTKVIQARIDGEKETLKATVEMKSQLESLRTLLETKDGVIRAHLETIEERDQTINSLSQKLQGVEDALREADHILATQRTNPKFIEDNTASLSEKGDVVSTEITLPLETEKMLSLFTNALNRLSSYMEWANSHLNDRVSKYTGGQRDITGVVTDSVNADVGTEEVVTVNAVLDRDREMLITPPQSASSEDALRSAPKAGDAAKHAGEVTMASVTPIIITLGLGGGDLESVKRSIQFPLHVANNKGEIDTGNLSPQVLEFLKSGTIH